MISYEQHRLTVQRHPVLFQRLDWISDSQQDGAGFDILSFEDDPRERFIEVKNPKCWGGLVYSGQSQRNDVSKELEEQFHIYRVFQFGD